jgi:hypothetical protein
MVMREDKKGLVLSLFIIVKFIPPLAFYYCNKGLFQIDVKVVVLIIVGCRIHKLEKERHDNLQE